MLFLATTISLILSLLAKLAADTFLTSRISVLGSFAGFQYAVNKGVAFSITFPGYLQNILITIALLALAWAAWHAKTLLNRIAFGMILGGALANVADRMRDGFVTDFLQVGTFPIFNVADSCITIGVVLLCGEAILQWSRKKQ